MLNNNATVEDAMKLNAGAKANLLKAINQKYRVMNSSVPRNIRQVQAYLREKVVGGTITRFTPSTAPDTNKQRGSQFSNLLKDLNADKFDAISKYLTALEFPLDGISATIPVAANNYFPTPVSTYTDKLDQTIIFDVVNVTKGVVQPGFLSGVAASAGGSFGGNGISSIGLAQSVLSYGNSLGGNWSRQATDPAFTTFIDTMADSSALVSAGLQLSCSSGVDVEGRLRISIARDFHIGKTDDLTWSDFEEEFSEHNLVYDTYEINYAQLALEPIIIKMIPQGVTEMTIVPHVLDYTVHEHNVARPIWFLESEGIPVGASAAVHVKLVRNFQYVATGALRPFVSTHPRGVGDIGSKLSQRVTRPVETSANSTRRASENLFVSAAHAAANAGAGIISLAETGIGLIENPAIARLLTLL